MQRFQRTLKQREATGILAHYFFAMLFGGSRSGKTFIIIRSIILRALKVKSKHLIVRFRFNHVKSSIWYDTFPDVMAICFPELQRGRDYILNKQDLFVRFRNGSEIWMGGIDSKERTEKILGNKYSTIYANECSQVEFDAIEVLMTRLAEKSGLPMRFWFDCNPPAKSHWTYKLFVERKDPVSGEAKNSDMYGALLMNPKDNVVNLPKGYIENTLKNLSKRQRERFELGLFLNDVEGALWKMELLAQCIADYSSYQELKQARNIVKVVMGVDPSTTAKENSDLCGIVIIAIDDEGYVYVIADYSIKTTPGAWADKIIHLYDAYDVNSIVVETNQGGDMVATILQSKGFYGDIIEVHASQSKHCRAEPVLAQYEIGRVKHLNSESLRDLEEEQTTYVPLQTKKSPDRLDALVWAITSVLEELNNIAIYNSIDFVALRRRMNRAR